MVRESVTTVSTQTSPIAFNGPSIPVGYFLNDFNKALADHGALAETAQMFILSLSDQGADADDRVIDVLGKLVAHLRAHFVLELSIQSIGGREAAQIGEWSRYPGR